jgi:glycerate 2-kinase
MTDLAQLRSAAREIFDDALRAVNAEDAVRRAVRFTGSSFSVCEIAIDIKPVYAVAIGKAALAMAYALEQALGQFFTRGVLVGPAPSLDQAQWLSTSRWNWYVGGHPLPSPESLAAAADAVGLLQRANHEQALVLFLISGGGSAMMEWPATRDITLADLQDVNRVLVNCGASISEINSVRRTFSAVKGGKLAARAPNCEQITLLVSDVPAGEEYNVGSGVAISPPPNALKSSDVIAQYNLRTQLSATIIEAIERPREFTADSNSRREHFVILSNEDALLAAALSAQRRGYKFVIAREVSDQPIAEGSSQLFSRLDQLRSKEPNAEPVCLISGGEFACPVIGNGVGGRNLETALRLAILHADSNRNDQFVAVCAGTDGIDGNSLAAGGIIDHTTIERATAAGLNAEDFLRRSDAFSFFDALGDVILTGPTGTNVRDVRILIKA